MLELFACREFACWPVVLHMLFKASVLFCATATWHVSIDPYKGNYLKFGWALPQHYLLLSGANVTLTYSIRNTANVRARNVSLSVPGVNQISCGNGLGSRIPSIDVDATIICRCATADARQFLLALLNACAIPACLPS
jgi:hypothetical protein